jgi:hypothetical protein
MVRDDHSGDIDGAALEIAGKFPRARQVSGHDFQSGRKCFKGSGAFLMDAKIMS